MAPCGKQRSFCCVYGGISGIGSVTATSKSSCKNEDSLLITRPCTALVQRYAPELEKRCWAHLRRTTDSWRVDAHLCESERGVGLSLPSSRLSLGNTLEFWLSATRDVQAAKHFFANALDAFHIVAPRVITVDKNAAYPKPSRKCKSQGILLLVANSG